MNNKIINLSRCGAAFHVLFAIYSIANIAFYVMASMSGELSVDEIIFEVKGGFNYSLLLTLVLLSAQYFVVIAFNNLNIKEYRYSDSDNKILCFSLLYQIAFYFYNITYGYGVAGQSISQDSVFKYLFYIVSPDLIALIVSVSVAKSRLYYLNLLFFVFSMLARGWAGGVVFFGLIILINSNYLGLVDIVKKSGFKVLILIVIVVALIPILNAFKFFIRDDGVEGFSYYLDYILNEDGFFGVIDNSVVYLIQRFSIVGSAYIINDNKDMLAAAYESGEIYPYWSENNIVSSLYKYFEGEGSSASNYVAKEILGYTDATWNTHVGFIGWITFLPIFQAIIFFAYYLIVLLVGLFFSKLLGGRVFHLMAALSLMYLYHGWLSSFILMIYSMIFILFLRYISCHLKLHRFSSVA